MATALLEEQEVKRPGAAKGETGPVPYHWTVDTLSRALAAGVFDHPERLELIQGNMIENPPMNPPHASLADMIAQMLRDALQPPLVIREEKCIHIAFDGEPVPNISVVRGKRTDYRQLHPRPEDVALLVEIADTTTDYDLGEKSLLYAQAGINDYWVVLVNEGVIVQHREPSPDGYQSVTRLAGNNAISPLAMPEAVWTVGALLGEGMTPEMGDEGAV